MAEKSIDFSTLASVPLLAGLDPEELVDLAPHIEVRDYRRGDTIFLQNDPGGDLLIVAKGLVELFVYDDDQQRIVLNTAGNRRVFRRGDLVQQRRSHGHAMATDQTEILVVKQKVMIDSYRHPDAAIHVIGGLSNRLRDNTQLLSGTRNRSATAVLNEMRANVWDRVADSSRGSSAPWPYLTFLVGGVLVWILLNIVRWFGVWDRPFEFNVLNLCLTVVSAMQVPLILMAQRRQDEYTGVAADLDHEVNVRAQLAILEVTRKLDWLQNGILDQSERLEQLENEIEIEVKRPRLPASDAALAGG